MPVGKSKARKLSQLQSCYPLSQPRALPSRILLPTALLRLRSLRFRLGRLLSVRLNHDHRQERPHHRGAEQDQDYGYADCPHARWEEALKGVVFVDEGLGWALAWSQERWDIHVLALG